MEHSANHSAGGSKKTEILILGGGFGGLYAALRLEKTLAKRDDCRVTLVNEENFTLFTPMLHEVAASDLDPTDIVNPIRKMLKRTIFYEASVQSIDLHGKTVTIAYGIDRTRTLRYDQLLITIGSVTRFFDDDTKANALQMKSLSDALFLRNHMIGVLENAEVENDPQRRKRLLTFAVAGGGFAGVETIGAMNDFLREATEYYPQLTPDMLRVILVHPGEVLLPEFDKSLGEYTGDRLKEAGIELRFKTKVSRFDGSKVELSTGETFDAATLVWTAGVVPSPLIATLACKTEKGRIVVDRNMEVEGFPGVWAVGDCANVIEADSGKPTPATAQHAMREGKVVARNIEAAVLGGGREKKPFRYKTLGQLAAIGQRRGAAQILGFKFSGFIAWWLWRTAYLSKLPRLEKKLRVAMNWTLDLIFSKDMIQIITVKEVERITRFGLRRLGRKRFEPADPTNGDGQTKPVEAAAI